MTNIYKPESLYLTPTLVIGAGGTGVEILRLVKSRIRQSLDPMPSIVEFLALDTEPVQNLAGQERIPDRDFAYLGDYNARSVLDHLDRHPHIKEWWYKADRLVSGSIHKGARQKRNVGRLSLYVKWDEFERRLSRKADSIREVAEKEKAQQRGVEVERNTGLVQVYIIASVCGGTGAGTLMDVAFKVRQLFKDEADIMGVLLLPSCFLPVVQSQIQRQRIQANAYSVLRELNAFMKGMPFDALFPDTPYDDGRGNRRIERLYRPFDSLYLVDRGNGKEQLSGLSAIWQMAAQQLYLEILSPLGKRKASRRANLRDLAGERTVGQDPLFVAGFSTASLYLPTEQLLNALVKQSAKAFLQETLLGVHDPEKLKLAVDDTVNSNLRALDQRLGMENSGESGNAIVPTTGGLKGKGIQKKKGTLISTIQPEEMNGIVERISRDLLLPELTREFQEGGLTRLTLTLEQLHTRCRQYQAELHESIATAEQSKRTAQQAMARIDTTQDNPLQSAFESFIALLTNQRSAGDDRRSQTMQRRSELQKQIKEQEQEITSNRLRVAALAKIEQDTILLHKDAQQLIKILNTIVTTLRDESYDGQDTQNSDEEKSATLPQEPDGFELNTPVGINPYVVALNGRTKQQSYLEAHLTTLTSKDTLRLSPTILAQARQSFFKTYFKLEVDPQAIGGHTLKVAALPLNASDQIRGWVEAIFADELQRKGESAIQLRIVQFFKWFESSVRYNNKSAMGTPIDPLQILKKRCERIFLEIDHARQGAEGSFNVEPVRLIGVDIDPSEDPLVNKSISEFDLFDSVATGVASRIDVSNSQHGFSLRALKDLKVWRNAFIYFNDVLRDSIHPHRDWDDIMADLDPDEPVGNQGNDENGSDSIAPSDHNL